MRLKRFCSSSLTCRCCYGQVRHQLALLIIRSWRHILLAAFILSMTVLAALPLIEEQLGVLMFPKIVCPDSSAGDGLHEAVEGSLPPHHQRVPIGNWSFMAPPHLVRICSGGSAKKPLLALVPVTSAMVTEREALRQTWGLELNSQFGQMLFLIQLPKGQPVAKALQTEFDSQRDILFAFHQGKNGEDTYRLLVRKVVAGLKWYSDHCRRGFDYVLKADHDSYWNVRSLLRLLRRHGPSEPLVFGSVQEGALVVRNTASKFFTPIELFSRTHFPPYASGGPGYALSKAAAVAIVEVAFRGSSGALWLEDVYLTGLLPEIAFPGCANRSETRSSTSSRFLHLHSDYIFICRYAIFTSAMMHHWPPLAMHKVLGHSLQQLHKWMLGPEMADKSNSHHSIVYSRSQCVSSDF